MGEAEDLRSSSKQSGSEILLSALRSFANENFSVRLPNDLDRVDGEFIRAFNAAAETNERFAGQIKDLAKRLKEAKHEIVNARLTQGVIEDKFRQMAQSARFKSEFLANASHELRAPLNSMLTLAKLLADNADKNLSSTQIDYAQTIYSAGTDLLSLIDDIVDLARIESGNVALHIEAGSFSDLRDHLLRAFRSVAQGKNLKFEIELDSALPAAIQTDIKRLQQILTNLLSNAFKFTRHGSVVLRIAPAVAGAGCSEGRVAFTVSDTGIGIAEDKQRLIFEAFHRSAGASDGTHAGSGLGLSICRELTRLLGGEIIVESAIDRGSRFSLLLPLTHEPPADDSGGLLRTPLLPEIFEPVTVKHEDVGAGSETAPARQETYYGRRSRRTDDGVVLIAEGDPRLAAVMLGLVRGGGHQGMVAADQATLELLLRELKPDAILLGANLRDVDGWTVLNQLKQNPETRLLPIHLTSVQQRVNRCLQIAGSPGMAVYEGLSLPMRVLAQLGVVAGRDVHKVLVAAPGDEQVRGWVEEWRAGGVEVTVVESGTQVAAALRRADYDAAIAGPELGDMNAIELLHRLLVSGIPTELPFALLGKVALAEDGMDEGALEIAVLKDRDRLEKILDEASVFLERAIGRLPNPREETPGRRHRSNVDLSGKTALLVDRDVRSIYALTGALEQNGMLVLHAESAGEGIDVLRRTPGIDVVIIDLSVPVQEGCETIRAIRGEEAFAALPIIVATSRAVSAEREQCLGAGASDCINKPVNVEHLLSLLRVWLVQQR